MSACRNVEVAGVRCKERNRKTWRERVKDMTWKCLVCSLNGQFLRIYGGTNPSLTWKKWTFSK